MGRMGGLELDSLRKDRQSNGFMPIRACETPNLSPLRHYLCDSKLASRSLLPFRATKVALREFDMRA
jgi:hypothetical protein